MNQINIIGNLGRDAEQKNGQNNSIYWVLSVATTKKYKDKQGNKKSDTVWHRVSLYGNYGNLVPYLRIGQQVRITGEQKNVSYDVKDNNNNNVIVDGRQLKNTLSYIVCREIELIGNAQSQQQSAPQQQNTNIQQQNNNQYQQPDTENDDLPF